MKLYINKILDNSISERELNDFSEWLKDPKNQLVLQRYIKDNHDLNLALLQQDHNAAYQKILERIKLMAPTKVVPFYKRNFFKYAASVLLFLAVGYYFVTKDSSIENDDPITTISNKIPPGSDKATLTLENGLTIDLDSLKQYTNENLLNDGRKLVYNKSNKEVTKINYNYLTVPRKGQYFVELSDGTQVWLNSESQLKYPVKFVKGAPRQVELVYGEAYFDVSPSKDNNGTKFKVLTNGQELEVLGTEFNVKAYNDETFIYTTLVEGKVLVANSANQEILKPDEQSVLDKNGQDFIIAKVDTYSEIAWKRGFFSFKNKSLKDISRVLSRWYDVDFVFIDKATEAIKFKGVLNKNQSIDQILELIKNTNYINNYEINNNTIIIGN